MASRSARSGSVLFALAVAACGSPGGPGATGFLDEAYTTQCPAQTVEGIDVYDGQGAINWTQVAGAGKQFAFIKATQGNYNKQSRFAANWSGAKAAGLLRSPYHFFDPTIDGVTQANWFLAQVGALEATDLPAMLDFECPTSATQGSASANCEYQGNSGWAPPATITQRALDWLATVEAKTGKKPIIYSYPSWFADVMQTDARFAAYPLYIATLANCASVPAPWTRAVFWQYSFTGTVAGVSGQVDLDRFMGTLAELRAFASPALAAQANGNESLSLVDWPDGHVELFGVSPKGAALHTATTGTGDAWSAPATLDTGTGCGFATSFWGLPWSYPELFAPRAQDTAHLFWASGAWNTFMAFGGGGDGLAHLSTVVGTDGTTHVFALATSGADAGAIEEDHWDVQKGDWSGWASLGSAGAGFSTGAAAIARSDGRLDLFATDAAGQGYWNEAPAGGAFAGWNALPAEPLASRPIPVRFADDHLELFARDSLSHLVHSVMTNGANGSFGAWAALDVGVAIAGEPSAAMSPGGNGGAAGPFVVARDTLGRPVHLDWNGAGYTPFAALGAAQVASDPFAWVRGDGNVEVFAIDANGSLERIYRDPANGFGSWTSIGGGFDACPDPAIALAATDGGGDGATPGDDGGTTGADLGRAGAPDLASAASRDLGGAPDLASGGVGSGKATGGGCGCTVGASKPPAPGAILLVGLAFAIGRRRRSRPRHGT